MRTKQSVPFYEWNQVEYLARIGHGNVSHGVRALIAQARAREDEEFRAKHGLQQQNRSEEPICIMLTG